jgi:hypothetical protein
MLGDCVWLIDHPIRSRIFQKTGQTELSLIDFLVVEKLEYSRILLRLQKEKNKGIYSKEPFILFFSYRASHLLPACPDLQDTEFDYFFQN